MTEAHQNIAIPSKQLGITGNIRLGWLISFILLVLMISISAGFSFLNYKSLKKTALDEIDKKLLIATDMAKESLTKNYHDQIKNEDSISKDEFAGIVKNFDRLCLAHDLEYIWSVMYIDGVIRFTSATSQFKKKHRNHASFFDAHSNPNAYIPVFETMERKYTLIEDKWGSLRSVLVPAYDSHGRKYLFGACMKLDDVENLLRGHLYVSIASGLFLCVVMSIVGLIITNRFSSQINTITDKIRISASGDYGASVPVTGVRELRVLADSFNMMSSTIAKQIIALEESEEKFKMLFENAPDAYYLNDLEGNFIDGNKAAEELIGYERDELIGKSFLEADIMPSDQIPKAANILEKGLGGQITIAEEIALKRKDGSSILVEISSMPIKFKHQKVFVGIARNITERKRLEESLRQAQKMEAIGTLAGGIAHDFNNILSPLLGYAEMLKEDLPADHPFQENADAMLSSALRARDLVQQILTFSRKSESKIKPIKLQPIIREAIKLLRSSIPKTIEMSQSIDADCGSVNADPTQFHQIIMNIATNAYHAMEETGGKLTVTLKQIHIEQQNNPEYPDLFPGTYAHLTVADTGIGMAKDVIDKVFDPYFTTKGTDKGTGLGLSVVHGIVKSLGGNIRIYSTLGKGTDFHVFMPIIESEEEKRVDETDFVLGGTERILLVDDEVEVASIEHEMLERLGYNLTTRTAGIEALETFKANPDKFDLIVTDMTMPNITGIQLAQEIKNIKADIPIIVCTGFSSQLTDEKCNELGIQGYLMKPVAIRELAGKIRNVLDTPEEES